VPNVFDRAAVVRQLRYGGVLAAVEVARAGYPVRMPVQQFLTKFKLLIPEAAKKKPAPKPMGGLWRGAAPAGGVQVNKELLERARKGLELQADLVPEDENYPWAVGKTTVFFKQRFYDALTLKAGAILEKSAIRLQTAVRRYVRVIYLQKLRKLCKQVQSLVRMQASRRSYLTVCRAVRKMQSRARAFAARQRFLVRRVAAALIQRKWRSHAAEVQ
jgi:myosin-5